MEKNQIKIYKIGKSKIEVQIKKDTIWLTQKQLANLFEIDRTVIGRHLKNIFATGELEENSVSAIFAHTASDGKTYQVKYYNLDVIISVGYRVNSKKATQFRVWATNTLKDYLIDGYVIDKKRLERQERKLIDIQKTIELIRNKSDYKELEGHEKNLLDIISEYSKSLVLLDKFDQSKLEVGRVNRYLRYELQYQNAQQIIKDIRKKILSKKKEDLFGNEMGGKLKGIVGAINQTFDGVDLYQSIEEKAANLLYLVIKDHPFSDGNKRIASMLFIHFLNQNKYLYKSDGEKKINDNAMVAIALLIATSDPREKESIINLVINLVSE